MTLTTREPTMRYPNKERSASGGSHKPRSPILRDDDWLTMQAYHDGRREGCD